MGVASNRSFGGFRARSLAALCAALAIVAAVALAGCGWRPGPLSFSELQPKAVATAAKDGTRQATFMIIGRVENKTGVPLTAEGLPLLEWSGDAEGSVSAQLKSEKLNKGESAVFSYMATVDFDSSSKLVVSYESDFECIGFDDAVAELNKQIEAVAQKYAAEDAEKAAEEERLRQEQEAKAAEEEQKRKEQEAKKAEEEERERKAKEEREAKEAEEKRVKAELKAFVGKTADEARDAAASADYTPRFEDQDGNTVTFYVMEGDEDLQIHSAKVTDCSFGFWGKEVTYKLEYAHPTPESCVERPLLEVADELKAAGVGFVLKHAKSGMDMTSSYEYGDFDDADMVITKAEKKFGSGNGSTSAEEFTLTIISQADREADAAKQATRETLKDKLDLSSAWWAVEDYGKWQYGDDFTLHWQTDPLAQEAEDENTWFLKAHCTCYGEQFNCEARVTGTTDDPQVIYFAVY